MHSKRCISERNAMGYQVAPKTSYFNFCRNFICKIGWAIAIWIFILLCCLAPLYLSNDYVRKRCYRSGHELHILNIWHNRRSGCSSCWDMLFWIWLGIVCSIKHDQLTRWTCVLTRHHNNRSHGSMKLYSNSPVVSKCPFYLLEHFSSGLIAEKYYILTHLSKDCLFLVTKFSHPSNSKVF